MGRTSGLWLLLAVLVGQVAGCSRDPGEAKSGSPVEDVLDGDGTLVEDSHPYPQGDAPSDLADVPYPPGDVSREGGGPDSAGRCQDVLPSIPGSVAALHGVGKGGMSPYPSDRFTRPDSVTMTGSRLSLTLRDNSLTDEALGIADLRQVVLIHHLVGVRHRQRTDIGQRDSTAPGIVPSQSHRFRNSRIRQNDYVGRKSIPFPGHPLPGNNHHPQNHQRDSPTSQLPFPPASV